MIGACGLAWPRCLHGVTGVTGSRANPSQPNPLNLCPCDGCDGCDRLPLAYACRRARTHARTRVHARYRSLLSLSHLSHPSQVQRKTKESGRCAVTGSVTGVTG